MNLAIHSNAPDVVAATRVIVPRIVARAAAADKGDTTLTTDIDDLRSTGLLRAPLALLSGGCGLCWQAGAVADGLDVLRLLGRANLAVARLFEGHVNAVKLVMLYGEASTQNRVAHAVRNGALMGVWGADGAEPLTIHIDGDRVRLEGQKRFASGLGLVSLAVLTGKTADGATRLVVATADDTRRADATPWQVSGMRATASGNFEASGLILAQTAFLGGPDDYHREPHFHGGVWRYAAAQLGGIEAMVEAMRSDLAAQDRLLDPHQAARFARSVIACETARLWVVKAAHAVEMPGADAAAATQSVLARLVVERAATDTMAEVDRALGTASFFAGHPVERIRRDLSLYLRQAAPDAALHRTAKAMADTAGHVGDFWVSS
ncbi:MAG: acyl-CoA dehydrogenase [Loktanella sp.]|nr:acyl-CoA dehydrogenase [Loktanella sp.]